MKQFVWITPEIIRDTNEEKGVTMSVNVDIKALFEAGAHFGHKTSRWHPRMAGYIHSKRGDSHIINLDQTVEQLEKALPMVTKIIPGFPRSSLIPPYFLLPSSISSWKR